MKAFKVSAVAALLVLGLSTLLVAQGEKKMGRKAPGILQPQMKVEGGSYAAPMGKLGTAGDVWSATTNGASVDGKPNQAKTATVTHRPNLACFRATW